MKLRWLAVAMLACGLGLGCSQESAPAAPGPGLDTLRAALGERDELERIYLLTSFLRTLRPEDVPAMIAEVEKRRAGIDEDEVRLIMLAWTRFDGPGAFATARDWPTGWKSVLMEQAMYAWGWNDGRAALAANEEIEDEDLRKDLEIALVSGWVSSHDRLGATEFAATVSEPRRRNRLALRLAGEAKRDGPDAVIAWVDAVPEDAPNDFKTSAFGHGAGALTRLDPERATSWYGDHMSFPYARAALRNIASKWAQFHDPEALLAWLETVPLPEDREAERVEAVKTAFRIWAAEAPEEAEAWIVAASPGATRDVAIDELARAIVDDSPGRAVEWAGRIADDELRRKRVLRYTRRWFAADPDAAGTWIADADMPDGWRKQVLNNLPQAVRWSHAKSNEPDG